MRSHVLGNDVAIVNRTATDTPTFLLAGFDRVEVAVNHIPCLYVSLLDLLLNAEFIGQSDLVDGVIIYAIGGQGDTSGGNFICREAFHANHTGHGMCADEAYAFVDNVEAAPIIDKDVLKILSVKNVEE